MEREGGDGERGKVKKREGGDGERGGDEGWREGSDGKRGR